MTTRGQFAKPDSYYTFDEINPVKSSIGNKILDTDYYKCPLVNRPSQVEKCGDFTANKCILVCNSFANAKPKSAVIEFLFKGKGLQYLAFPNQTLNITLNESQIYFSTTSNFKGVSSIDEMNLQYSGKGKDSYNYLADGGWHHLVFLVDLVGRRKEIWIDGELLAGYGKKIENADFLVFPEMDGFKGAEFLDEIAFYTNSVSPNQIRQHYAEFTNGLHYSYTEKNVIAKKRPGGLSLGKEQNNGGYDINEFAPGYPEYTIQALDQLKSFPLPRYKSGVKVRRNFPWADINYLHRELPGIGGKGFGKVNPKKAIEIEEELSSNWNYFLEIPCLRVDGKSSQEKYGNPATLEGALVAFANSHPELPLSTVVMQIQNHPEDIGRKHKGSFVNSQELPDKYYLRDANGKVVILNGRKWLSPLMPLDIIKTDAENTRFYLSQLVRFLKRPIDFINENGELFGNIRPEELWNLDPEVVKHKKRLGLNNYQYNGYFQKCLDSTYKAEVFKLPELKNTKFSFYNISAVQAAYWPDYNIRRSLNYTDNNISFSTPDFYPAFPANWRNARGSLNGYGTLAQGRKIELSLGDKLFSPFVSAGWDIEEKNIRPAQWLALLKAMIMLGADFFYTGYFNVTDSDGKWPNGEGPNDPRGYVYQLAMPSYAQAILTYAQEFISSGELMNPAAAGDIERQFRFKGNDDNELILVRKLGNRYLIYGSLQTSSNFFGAVPNEVVTSIMLNGKQIKFTIRRQGSVYIYEDKPESPIFYQLDNWHQYEHPYYWSKESNLEAEMADELNANSLVTERNSTGMGDFSVFTTAVLLQDKKNNKSVIEWTNASRNSMISNFVVNCKPLKSGTSFKICINGNCTIITDAGKPGQWNSISAALKTSSNIQGNKISLELLSGELLVNNLVLKP